MQFLFGTETEFGILGRGTRSFDPVSGSMALIANNPYGMSPTAVWDYEPENPLLDARGFEEEGEQERPGPTYNGLLNKLLYNGGRLYVDGPHPEYSTPECTDLRSLIAYEKAGERIVEACLERVNRQHPDTPWVIYKNNTDHKGHSYGYHENYLVERGIPFDTLVTQLMPFLVTRQIYAGAGKVGTENRTSPTTYQISQRADFFETLVGLSTMVKRPIINTRDEPHADPARYRRLHVIVGDANMSEVSTYLKVGTLALVLAMVEKGTYVSDMTIDDPISSIKAVSRDLTLKKTILLSSGHHLRALDVQRAYWEAAERHFSTCTDPAVKDILYRWQAVLTMLDHDPMQLDREIDWVMKKRLIDAYVERKGIPWTDPRVTMMDLQYHDVTQEKGLYYTLERSDRATRLVSSTKVTDAQQNPPKDTRAYFRGHCLKKFSKDVYAASWSSLLFDAGENAIKRVPLMDPHKGTERMVGAILERVTTLPQLLSEISS